MMIRLEKIIPKKHSAISWYYRNDPELWQYANPDAPMLATQQTEYEFYKQRQKSNDRYYAIYCNEDYVGNIVLKNIQSQYGTAEIKIYIFRKEFRGKGIATQAIHLLRSIALHSRIDLLYAYVAPENKSSYNAFLHNHFCFTGFCYNKDHIVHRLELTRTANKRNPNRK